MELKIVTNGKFRPAYHGHNWKTKKSRCLAPYLRLMGIKILQKLTKVRQRSVIEHTVIPRDSGHITFYTNESSLIRNEQVVGSSPIASSSDFKASGDAPGAFLYSENPWLDQGFSKAYSDESLKVLRKRFP